MIEFIIPKTLAQRRSPTCGEIICILNRTKLKGSATLLFQNCRIAYIAVLLSVCLPSFVYPALCTTPQSTQPSILTQTANILKLFAKASKTTTMSTFGSPGGQQKIQKPNP
jgi:hypothetical protein